MVSVNQYFELLAPANAAYNNFAKKEGINYSTLAIYEYLYTNKKATAGEVSNNWGIPKQTLHSAIKELEKKEYLTFEENLKDKRSKFLLLTKKGREVAYPIVEKLHKKEGMAFSILSEEEKNILMELTKRFAQSLTKEVNND